MKYFLFFALSLLSDLAFSQPFTAVQKIEGERMEYITKLCFTKQDDYVAAGMYNENAGVTFQSLNGKEFHLDKKLDSFPRYDHTLFLAKYSKHGNIKWVLNATAENGIYTTDMNIDSLGNILVCGNFRGKAIFNSADKKTSTSIQGSNAVYWNERNPHNYFIAKYNPSGILLWVKSAISDQNSIAMQVETDASCNVFVRTYCEGSNISFENFSLLPHKGNYIQSYHFMVVKYDPKGKEQWATYGGNATTGLTSIGMKVTPNGKVGVECSLHEYLQLFSTNGQKYEQKLAAGFNRGIAFLDENGGFEKFVPEVNSQRYLPCIKRITNAKNEQYLILKAANNYYQKDRVTWKNEEFITQQDDIFLAKVNAQNEEDWIIRIATKNDELPIDLAFDKKGNVLLSGWYWENVDIVGTGEKTVNLKADVQGLFVASFTEKGELIWAENCGNTHYTWRAEPTLKLSVNSKNKLFAYGQVNISGMVGDKSVLVLGEHEHYPPEPEPHPHFLKYSDAFIVQRDLNTPPEIKNSKPDSVLIALKQPLDLDISADFNKKPRNKEEESVITALLYPNPLAGQTPIIHVQLQLSKAQKVQWLLTDANGKVLLEEETAMSENNQIKEFSFEHYEAGVYLLRIQVDGNNILKRIVLL